MRLRKLDEFMVKRGGSVDPSKFKNETFDLLSIPAFDQGRPEIIEGEKIGSAKKIVEPRDVLLSKIVPHIRRCWVVPDRSNKRQIASGEWIQFRGDDFFPEYLRLFLVSNRFHSMFMKTVKGVGGSLLRASPSQVAEIEIPLPPLDDQKRIAHLLGKVEGLIARRKQHLRQLDDLLKGVFLEMFGDIKAKRSPHPWEKLRPYLNARSGKSNRGIISDVKTEFPIYGGNGVNGWSTKPLYNEPIIVAGRVGQQCGIIHVSTGACWVTDNAIAIEITDPKRLNTTYLSTAFQYAPIREKVKQLDLPFINQSMLLDYLLPLPPIDLQNQFATIVEKVEGIKFRYQKSLKDLENLYGALSQKAFKGELDLSRVELSIEAITEEPEKIATRFFDDYSSEAAKKAMEALNDFNEKSGAFRALQEAAAISLDSPTVKAAQMLAEQARLWKNPLDELKNMPSISRAMQDLAKSPTLQLGVEQMNAVQSASRMAQQLADSLPKIDMNWMAQNKAILENATRPFSEMQKTFAQLKIPQTSIVSALNDFHRDDLSNEDEQEPKRIFTHYDILDALKNEPALSFERLSDKLSELEAIDLPAYERIKGIVFELLVEGSVEQVFDENSQSLLLRLAR